MLLKKSSSSELIRCVASKLEQASNASSNASLGKSLFAQKKLELAPFSAIKFSSWGNWEQDPLTNRSWQWRLNWLSFLSYLMAYHRASEDDAVLNFAREAIQSWLDTYLETDTSYPFEFIWHDHATALRAEQLVLFIYYCKDNAPAWAAQHADFLQYVEQALLVHGEWLAKDSFYSEHTNHGLEQARVLLLLGTVFKGEQASQWQKIAILRINSELNFAFTDEGVHVENSPAYHIFVFKVFMGIIKDYPAEVLGDLAEQFEQLSAKALSFITHILRPDGKLPPIGDTEQLTTSDGYRDMFGHMLEYQYFLYASTQGRQGVIPPNVNRIYPRSGYAIFRDQWPTSEHYTKAFHLIAKVGCSSRYHHQQDEGHISLYAGGEDWLIDSGLYNYINNDPVRKYMRGRPGHNVPLISNASYDKEFEHRLHAWQVTDASEEIAKPGLTMKLEVLQPVVHTRRVDFDAQAKVVEIEDEIVADDNELRNITFQWHFPKDKTITIEGNQVVVTSSSGNRLLIEFKGEIPDSVSVVKGRKDERVFSCISYKANQVEPSQLLRVLFKDRAELKSIAQFSFELAEDKVAPAQNAFNSNTQPFASMLAQWQKNGQCQHSVMLGNTSNCLELAKAHRAQSIGHISLLVNDAWQCSETQAMLSQYYLTTWLTCRQAKAARTLSAANGKAILQGIEGVDLLVITGCGYPENQLPALLLIILPLLFKRMTVNGQVWVSNSLPENLKALCITWGVKQDLLVTCVTDLE